MDGVPSDILCGHGREVEDCQTCSPEPTSIGVGSRVRALYPNARWGEGVVIDDDLSRKGRNPATGRTRREKPLIVRRDDNTLGHFHYDQVEAV